MSNLVKTFANIPDSDWYLSVFAILLIAFSLILAEIGIKSFRFYPFLTRKFVHILTGMILCIAAILLSSNLPIILFAVVYIFFDLWALRKGKLPSIHPDSSSFGTVFYATSVMILALIFWGRYKPLFIITNLIMIIPDAMAAIIGERFGRAYFRPVSEKKSLAGAMTMFSLTTVIVFATLVYFYNHSPDINIIISLCMGAVATAAELLSARGSDNLSVPLISGLFLYAMLSTAEPDSLVYIATGIISAAIVALISQRLHFLDSGGSILAFLMGSVIFGFGRLAYTLPIMGFFIFSSILSKTGKKKKTQPAGFYQKSTVRDFYQTLANGGVATALVVIAYFSKIESVFFVYIAAVAAATADTWGTEVGIFSKTEPILITTRKPVSPGTSGAISLFGSVSALFGSFFIVLIGRLFYDLNLSMIIILTFVGFLGSLMDSFLGATVQGLFKCHICGVVTERKTHCGSDTTLQKGNYQIDNDVVNILSILFSSIITFFIFIEDII